MNSADPTKKTTSLQQQYPMTWDDVESPVNGLRKSSTVQNGGEIEGGHLEKLGYKPVLSAVFSSFSGICRMSEYRRTVALCFGWAIVYLIGFFFVFNGVLERVSEQPRFESYLESGTSFASGYFLVLLAMFVIGYFFHVGYRYFTVLVRRFHAHGWSFSTYVLLPFFGYLFADYMLESVLTNIKQVRTFACLATVEQLLTFAYWVYNLYLVKKIHTWAKIDMVVETNNPATTRLLKEMEQKARDAKR